MDIEVELSSLVLEFTKLATNGLVIGLTTLILVDIATGISKSFITETTSSKKGLKGLMKHTLIIFIALIITPVLNVLQLPWVAQSLTMAFIVMYGVSIVENLKVMGIPVPNKIVQLLEQLKEEK